MSYVFLSNWGLTPWDLGAAREDVDLAWAPAMIAIEAGVADARPRGGR